MAVALQRSVTSFRRQGSSGLVWDERLFSSEVDVIVKKPNREEDLREELDKDSKLAGLRQSHSDGSIQMIRCPTRVPFPTKYSTSRVLPTIMASPENTAATAAVSKDGRKILWDFC